MFSRLRGLSTTTKSIQKWSHVQLRSNALSTGRPQSYSRLISTYHWIMAGGILGCFSFVELAKRQPKGDPKIGQLMTYHKSFGLIMMAFIIARFSRRFIFINNLKHIPDKMHGPIWQQYGSTIAHYSMYGLMIFMPVTGITMGYFGGKGLPFFNYKIPGTDNPNKQVARTAYKYHKIVGKIFEFTVGLHLSAALFHIHQGQKPLNRINPFVTSSSTIAAFLFESIEDGYLVDMDIDDEYYDFNDNNK